MAIALNAGPFTGQNKTAGTVVGVTGTTADVPAGATVFAYVVFDNTTATTPTITSLSKQDSGNNDPASWSLVVAHNSPTATGDAGVRGELWRITTTELWDDHNVTATLSASKTATTITVWSFTRVGATTYSSGIAGTTAITRTTTTDRLYLHGSGTENTTSPTIAPLTATYGWLSGLTDIGTTGGSAATNARQRSNYGIATSGVSNVSWTTSGNTDGGHFLAEFEEQGPQVYPTGGTVTAVSSTSGSASKPGDIAVVYQGSSVTQPGSGDVGWDVVVTNNAPNTTRVVLVSGEGVANIPTTFITSTIDGNPVYPDLQSTEFTPSKVPLLIYYFTGLSMGTHPMTATFDISLSGLVVTQYDVLNSEPTFPVGEDTGVVATASTTSVGLTMTRTSGILLGAMTLSSPQSVSPTNLTTILRTDGNSFSQHVIFMDQGQGTWNPPPNETEYPWNISWSTGAETSVMFAPLRQAAAPKTATGMVSVTSGATGGVTVNPGSGSTTHQASGTVTAASASASGVTLRAVVSPTAPVSGLAVAAGTITRRQLAAGTTGAVGTTSASASKRGQASGVVASVGAVLGESTSRRVASGTNTITVSTTFGQLSRVQSAAGTFAGASATAGDVTITAGSIVYMVSSLAAALSDVVAPFVNVRMPVYPSGDSWPATWPTAWGTGGVPGVSTVSGTATRRSPVLAVSAAVSAVSGVARARFTAAGVVSTTAATVGTTRKQTLVSGSVVASGGTAGEPGQQSQVTSGSVTAAGVVTGLATKRTGVIGGVSVSSTASGWITASYSATDWSEISRNLMRNPSFEANLNYTSVNRVTASISTDWSKNGSNSVLLTRTADANTDAYLDITQAIEAQPGVYGAPSLKPNTEYTIMATYHLTEPFEGLAEGTTAGLGQRLSLFVHLNGVGLGAATGVNSAGERTLVHRFTTPASFAGYNTIRLYGGDAASATPKIRWDSVALYEGNVTEPEYVDGSMPGTEVSRYMWTGAEHLSTSVFEERIAELNAVSGTSGSVTRQQQGGGISAALSSVAGASTKTPYVASGSSSVVSVTTGEATKTSYIATSTISGVSTVSGTLTRRSQAASVSAALSVLSGSVTSRRPALGTVSQGVSIVAGGISARFLVNGGVSALASSSGSTLGQGIVDGTVVSISTVSGAAAKTPYVASGVITALTTASGVPTKTPYQVSGSVQSSGTAFGAPTKTSYVASGTIATSSTLAGAVTSMRQTAGVVAAVSTAPGLVTLRQPLTGAVSTSSDSAGDITLRAQMTGGFITESSTFGEVTETLMLWVGRQEFFTSTNPFIGGPVGYDTIVEGQLVHAAEGALAHRVRWADDEGAYAPGDEFSVRFTPSAGSARLVGLAFVNAANTSQYVNVLADNRNGGGSTAALQIREGSSTTAVTGFPGAGEVLSGQWYRLKASYGRNNVVSATLTTDDGTLIATGTRAISSMNFSTFYPALYTYGGATYDEFLINTGVDASANSSGEVVKTTTVSGEVSAVSYTLGEVIETSEASGTVTAVASVVGDVSQTAFVDGIITETSSTLGSVYAVRPAVGISDADSTVAGEVTGRYALARAVSATSTTLGSIRKRTNVAGTAITTSTAAGIVGRRQQISGIKFAVSGAAGTTAQRFLITSETVDAVSVVSGIANPEGSTSSRVDVDSGITGSVTARLSVAESAVAAKAATNGTIRARYSIAGVVSISSTASGAPTKRAHGFAVPVVGVSGVLGTLVKQTYPTAAAQATGLVTGVVSSRGQTSGGTAGASGTTGELTTRGSVGSRTQGLSSSSGSVAKITRATGGVSAVSSLAGSISSVGKAVGTSTALSEAHGEIGLRIGVSGVVETLSNVDGAPDTSAALYFVYEGVPVAVTAGNLYFKTEGQVVAVGLSIMLNENEVGFWA